MEDKCKRCGAPVTSEQAFCQKCGAVIGMSAARKPDDPSENMAATVVGKASTSKSSTHRPPPTTGQRKAPTTGQRQAPRTQSHAAPQSAKGNTTILVVVGFIAVLLIGGLLMLLWLNA